MLTLECLKKSGECDIQSHMTLEKCFNCFSLVKNDNEDKAMRFNEGKPKWNLVHYKSLEPMVRVLEFGALKYAPRNWQKPMPLEEILNSMQRHLAALMDGEEFDKESKIHHMGHIMCNAMFYNYHYNKLKENSK